ncbi:MAG: polysulfide reductase NrfD [Haliscomenobacter sp.]|nr:polysulfide reductase NrfD [Haliscomenobacter sp.]
MNNVWWGLGLALVFLGATGALLVKDLDRPDRFLNVLLRPQWGSWLVRGGYAISVYGGLIALNGLFLFLNIRVLEEVLIWVTAISAAVVAIYTAFLFAQAKGRDFWQSPSLSLHMLVHSFMAGAAAFGILSFFQDAQADWTRFLTTVLIVGLAINLFTIFLEIVTPHPTVDAKAVVKMIGKGRYSRLFWAGVVAFGNILPLVLLSVGSGSLLLAASGLIALIGIYLTEHIWVEAPQRIPLV